MLAIVAVGPKDADAAFEAEWAMRARDLDGLVSPRELKRLRDLDRRALADGRRTLFVPTFHALGRKGEPPEPATRAAGSA